jgi:hypothetical protein
MSDPATLRQYAEAYRRLARASANPQLQALLIRMAEVWDALAVHTDRIAALRVDAENILDEPQDRGEPASRVDAPELSPRQDDLTRRHERTE